MLPLLVLFVTAFVDMIGLTMVIPLLPYYATDFGAGATMIGVLISAFSIAQLAVAPSWGRFSDRYGRRPAILAGLLLTAVAYVLFAFAGSIVALLVSRLIQGTGGGTIGVVQAYVADASKPKERTKSLGWLSVVTSMGAVAGPAFGSAMISLGGRRAPGLAAAVLSVLVSIFAWRFLRESTELRHTTSHPAVSAQTSRGAILRVLTRWREPAPRLIWIYTIAIGAFYGTIQTVPLLLSSRFSVTESNIGYFVMYLGGMGVLVRSLLLGRMVDRLGEARLSRLGIVILALGLASTGLATGYPDAGGGLHPDADRDGLHLPLRDGAPEHRGGGERARALHGRPAHLRRGVAGRVPDPGRIPDGPRRRRGALLALGHSRAGDAAADGDTLQVRPGQEPHHRGWTGVGVGRDHGGVPRHGTGE